MTASNNFPKYLESVEGLVLHPYQDSAGVWTIGIGSTRYEDGDKVQSSDPHITKERALELALHEAGSMSKQIAPLLFGVQLKPQQFDALLSLAYNIGTSKNGFAGSTVLKRVRFNPNDPAIRDAFNAWNKITVKGKLVVNQGLVNRRKKDADLYFS